MGLLSKKGLVGKITVASLGLVIFVLVIQYLPHILRLTVSIDEFRDYILSTGKLGPILLIFYQLLQIIIAPIPGEVIQIAGGYIYGISFGTLYITVGMLLGAIVAFYFTRFLGRTFIERLLKKDKFKWMARMLDNKKISVFLFIIFIIPGLPKDLFIYAAGLTTIKPLRFFTILLVARFPWLLASVSIGSNIYQQNYLTTIIISGVSILAFILGLIYKDKLINKLSGFKKSISES
ncbi:TVP38/TMEM64 family protein [Cohnella sp. CFH 77786]|uniref:TVP38/TMEM64 family protein n=1 Tax=Cohnella sp. CFH 77786 TaxID=2662265 RepID=UPI001C60D1DE|nr:VTT domain-containing protein [Cohnella sp. CFH 77786]MBW5448715.1 TVP38/TMEM64 family protein [Cohnella sp. CFH 77786]